MEDRIAQLFDRMDSWRHLPDYQLERRADLLFSLYLPAVLESRFGLPIHPELIPEFPVRHGTIRKGSTSNRSDKIDYLALSQNGATAIFVELKTDMQSRRTEQDWYLIAAKEVGLAGLLEGLKLIFLATNEKQKYFHLLDSLAGLGLLRVPPQMRDTMQGSSLRGAREAASGIEVTCLVTQHRIVYVQPVGAGPDVITFADFAAAVGQQDDPLSCRFAQSLARWANVKAGKARIDEPPA